MKKLLLAILFALVVFALIIFSGCSKSSTTTPTGPTNSPPAAPTGLNISQQVRQGVDLGWQVGTDTVAVDSFVINRSPDSLSWALITDTLHSSARAYRDLTIAADRKQYYRIKAANTYGSSDWVYNSIFTLPAVWNFSTDQTSMFLVAVDSVSPAPFTWSWNHADSTGKLSINATDDAQRYVHVITTDLMPNTGWFESKIKLPQWYGTGQDANYASFWAERDWRNTRDDAIGIFFSQDSTVFGYYASGTFQHSMTNQSSGGLPLLSSNSWHTIRLFHLNSHWDLIIDGTRYFSDNISNVAIGNLQLYEEWQFDRGVANPLTQDFYVDDVANNEAIPTAIVMPQGGARPMRSMRGIVHTK